jgi:hypothetical protein
MVRKELDPLGTDVTTPPSPSLITEPVFYNPKFDQMALEIEGGPSEEYLQANRDRVAVMAELIQALHDREQAEKLWQAGKRDEALAILQKNSNVGIEYRALAGGEVVRQGSYFGKDAADFLNGLNIAVAAGLLSPQTNGGAYSSHHSGANPQNSDYPPPRSVVHDEDDCHYLATTVDEFASKAWTDPGFINALRKRFVPSSNQDSHAMREFRSTGFKGRFNDDQGSYNQVRHFVGVFSNAYYWALAASVTNSDFGLVVTEAVRRAVDHEGATEYADQRLSAAIVPEAVALGYTFTDRKNLGTFIRQSICGTSW